MAVVLATIFFYRLILREESELSETQGESFRAYGRAVPRFFPALRARAAASGARPHWKEAFWGQVPWWGIAASLLAFAITLRPAVGYDVAGAGFLVFIVEKFVRESFLRSAAGKERR